VTAFYDEEIGHYGAQITQRKIERVFRLPDRTDVETVIHRFTPEGYLNFEIVLKKEVPFKCDVTTEELHEAPLDEETESIATESVIEDGDVNGFNCVTGSDNVSTCPSIGGRLNQSYQSRT